MTSGLNRLRPIIRLFAAERRMALLLGGLLSAATVLAGIGLLGLSGWFITATSFAGLTAASAIAFDVFAPSAGIRLLAISRTASRYGERLVTHDATLAVLAALRERLFRGWADARNAGQMMRRPAKLLFRLTADIDALDALYLRVLIPGGVAILSALFVSIAFGLMQPLFGLLCGLWLLLTGLGIPLIAARSAIAPGRRRAHAIEALRSRAIDLIAGQTDLAMSGRLQAQRAAILHADLRLAEADDALNRIECKTTAAFGFVSTVLLTATLLGAAALAKNGTIGVPVAALGLLTALAATEPFAALRRGALELGRTMLAAGRIAPRMETPNMPQHVTAPAEDLACNLVNVSVRHDGADLPALCGISLSVERGERISVVGMSGVGKSSLLAAIAGEIEPETGSVRRMRATTLTQRTELFRDTVRDNLRLANPGAGDGALCEALAAAGLLSDVNAIPGGLDAMLGEGGLGLSGGQSRRLALARLFLRDADLWLLDEPTEGLDGKTARDVLARLADRAEGRALIIATHIRREAEISNRILVLDGGSIVATARRGEDQFDAILKRLRPD